MTTALVILGAVFAAGPATVQEHRGVVMSVEMGGAVPFGPASSGVGAGATARGLVGYEIANGLTPSFSVEGTRFGSTEGSTWEIAALPGLRWYAGADRVRSWVEGDAGIGQFVYENDSLDGHIDVGLRLKVAGGIDLALEPFLSVCLHVAFNDARGGVDDHRWLDAGGAVDFAF
jgi:hypothetical protein